MTSRASSSIPVASRVRGFTYAIRNIVAEARKVEAAGKPVKLIVCEGYNHFEMMETLANPYGFLGRAALEQMHLASA